MTTQIMGGHWTTQIPIIIRIPRKMQISMVKIHLESTLKRHKGEHYG